jgi:hypothetical protein
VPCIAYIITASAYAYWLDSGEFVAAAVQLDIAHPPGHPLSALYGKLMSLLPIGSLSFRVALGQALATAAASALHCRANAAALRGMRLDGHVKWALALLGAWLSAFSYGLWFQAVRPEVYALQTLCVALVYERLLHASTADQAGARRALLTAAFGLGLALTNHHFIAVLLLPAFLPVLWTVVRQRRLGDLGAAFALGTLALSTYVYLPLRALRSPLLNLGDPSSWSRFFWVVSGQVYTHEVVAEQSLGQRMLDVIALWYSDLGLLPLVLACLGLYLGLRLSAARAPVCVCLLVWLVDAPARALLGDVRGNPDISGYLAPGYLALGTLASCGLGALAWSWRQLNRHSWLWGRRLALLLPLAALALVPMTWARASLRDFTATDDLDELRVRQLPPRALVLASSPQTVFRSVELSAVELVRPDVTFVPLPFMRYPNAAKHAIAGEPGLASILASYQQSHDQLTQAAPLLQLSRQRPLFVELDTRLDPGVYPVLAVSGVYAQVAAAPTSLRHSQLRLDELAAFLNTRLGAQQHESETARQLLWIHFMNAVQLGAIRQTALAGEELTRALALQPEEKRLQALQRALVEPAFDPSPFLTF